PMSQVESLSYEQSILGMTVGEHPMERYRDWLDGHGILTSTALLTCEHEQIVRVAGMNIMHQAPPTAKGHHFITLEDEHGMMNIIWNKKRVQQIIKVPLRDPYSLFRNQAFLIVEGTVQRKGGVVNVLASRIYQLISTCE